MDPDAAAGAARMDVDAVLQSVQERDKWRRRLELLTASLREVRDRRRKAFSRLRRIQVELRRLGEYSDAILEQAGGATIGRSNAPRNPNLPAR